MGITLSACYAMFLHVGPIEGDSNVDYAVLQPKNMAIKLLSAAGTG